MTSTWVFWSIYCWVAGHLETSLPYTGKSRRPYVEILTDSLVLIELVLIELPTNSQFQLSAMWTSPLRYPTQSNSKTTEVPADTWLQHCEKSHSAKSRNPTKSTVMRGHIHWCLTTVFYSCYAATEVIERKKRISHMQEKFVDLGQERWRERGSGRRRESERKEGNGEVEEEHKDEK